MDEYRSLANHIPWYPMFGGGGLGNHSPGPISGGWLGTHPLDIPTLPFWSHVWGHWVPIPWTYAPSLVPCLWRVEGGYSSPQTYPSPGHTHTQTYPHPGHIHPSGHTNPAQGTWYQRYPSSMERTWDQKYPAPYPRGQTDICENIIFSQLRFRR